MLNAAFLRFSSASGLQANLDKILLYIAGVNYHIKREILEELGFVEGKLPFRYLWDSLSYQEVVHYPIYTTDRKNYS